MNITQLLIEGKVFTLKMSPFVLNSIFQVNFPVVFYDVAVIPVDQMLTYGATKDGYTCCQIVYSFLHAVTCNTGHIFQFHNWMYKLYSSAPAIPPHTEIHMSQIILFL